MPSISSGYGFSLRKNLIYDHFAINFKVKKMIRTGLSLKPKPKRPDCPWPRWAKEENPQPKTERWPSCERALYTSLLSIFKVFSIIFLFGIFFRWCCNMTLQFTHIYTRIIGDFYLGSIISYINIFLIYHLNIRYFLIYIISEMFHSLFFMRSNDMN